MELFVCNVRSKKTSLLAKAIMYVIKRDYHHSVIRKIDSEDNDYIYHAIGKGFVKEEYSEWKSKYHIKRIANAVRKLNLNEDDCQKIEKRLEYYVNHDTDYGFFSLVGILIWKILKMKTVGIDGQENLICSEAIYRVFQDWLPAVDFPIDYVTPATLEEWFFYDKVDE